MTKQSNAHIGQNKDEADDETKAAVVATVGTTARVDLIFTDRNDTSGATIAPDVLPSHLIWLGLFGPMLPLLESPAGHPKSHHRMAHKLARILWHLGKHRQAYDPTI